MSLSTGGFVWIILIIILWFLVAWALVAWKTWSKKTPPSDVMTPAIAVEASVNAEGENVCIKDGDCKQSEYCKISPQGYFGECVTSDADEAEK